MIVNGKTLLGAGPIKDMLPGKHRQHGVSHGLAEAGYDIRIKQDVWFTYDERHDRMWVAVGDRANQHADKFALASAIEEFEMPDNLVGVVHDKSTWARQGLSVFNTVIEPGWKGFLTLELVMQRNQDLHIPAGAGIAQVLFSTLFNDAAYGGKYQNQTDKPIPAILA